MSGPVDDLWHTFILYTRQYARFCDEHAGHFLHHTPEREPDAQADDAIADALEWYGVFLHEYSAAFGESPPCARVARSPTLSRRRGHGPVAPRVEGTSARAVPSVAGGDRGPPHGSRRARRRHGRHDARRGVRQRLRGRPRAVRSSTCRTSAAATRCRRGSRCRATAHGPHSRSVHATPDVSPGEEASRLVGLALRTAEARQPDPRDRLAARALGRRRPRTPPGSRTCRTASSATTATPRCGRATRTLHETYRAVVAGATHVMAPDPRRAHRRRSPRWACARSAGCPTCRARVAPPRRARGRGERYRSRRGAARSGHPPC